MSDISSRIFDGAHAECELEDRMFDAGIKFERIGHDHYDNSLELYDVPVDHRLNEAQQRLISEAGFSKVYVNHVDGWETHYSWDWRIKWKPARGWRRRYVKDATAKTNRGDGPGYFEISYWPEGWCHPDFSDDIKRGYMRIVPDPLEASQTDTEKNPDNPSNSPGQER